MSKVAAILAIGLTATAGVAAAQADSYSSVARRLPGEVYPPGEIYRVAARCAWKKNVSQSLAFVDGFYDGLPFEDVKPLWNAATKGCNMSLGRIEDEEIRSFSRSMDDQHAIWLTDCVEKSSPKTLEAFRSEFAKAKKVQLKAYLHDAVHTSDSTALLACDPNMDNPMPLFSYRRANFLTRVLRKRVLISNNVGAHHATELS